MIYYASFIPGIQEVIAALLQKRLDDVIIQKLMDGAVIFETEYTYDRLNFFCFNNIFALIDLMELKNSSTIKPGILESHIKKILASKKKTWPIISENSSKIKSFRLVFSMENVLSPVNEALKQEMESFIEANSSLQISREKPDTEFWFLFRRELSGSKNFSCFIKRLTNNRSGEKSLHQGELSPQLAWLLCHIADLKHNEIVIDPFCGYGSIPKAACKYFPIKKFFASDIEAKCIRIIRSKKVLPKERCEIQAADFRSIPKFLSPGTVDAIVSDPPWGMYKTDGYLQELYNDMVDVFSKLLKSNGRAIILSAAQKELEYALEKNQGFQLNKTIPILVSGKKTSVFIFERKSSSK